MTIDWPAGWEEPPADEVLLTGRENELFLFVSAKKYENSNEMQEPLPIEARPVVPNFLPRFTLKFPTIEVVAAGAVTSATADVGLSNLSTATTWLGCNVNELPRMEFM